MTPLTLNMDRGARTARRVPAVGATAGATAPCWRKHSSARPHGQRLWVQSPHALITRRGLPEALAPLAGERLLEVGPGTDYYSLQVAERLTPGATPDLRDMQPMLDHTRHIAIPDQPPPAISPDSTQPEGAN